ncbi:MAG: hydroxyacid dehydrogenase [Peptococcaceae bacterium]|nr:hydroxyacid dehydrogenase [Candidatus Syntrophopropionicum ammoniitolerans]
MNLLLTGAFKYTKGQLDSIQDLGFDITFVQDERVLLSEVNQNIDIASIDAVVCNNLFLYNDINQFKSLKFIQLTSAGMDRVPLDYIKNHGIHIANARGVYSIPMAEWVVLKILEIYKNSRYFYKAQSERKWQKRRDLLEISGKTAAIIGLGNVGIEIAKRLNAFGVHVIGVDSRLLDPAENDLVNELCVPDEIDRVLNKSDIVILALPLTDQTRHMMNKYRFKAMRDGSVLVNVSRGGVIKETDLIEALQGNKFLGVALDVFEEEPLNQDSPLWNFDNVIITPHNSFISDKVSERMFGLIIENLNELKDSQLAEDQR